MPYLLDTNVLSELRRGHRGDPKLRNWQAQHSHEDQWISVISLMEVRIGVIRARRTDLQFSEALDKWYRTQLLPTYQNRILMVDTKVAELRAAYEATRTVAYSDALIAATAAAHGHTLVTRNVKDFEGLGIKLVNPWKHPIG
jgi:predicted nucleic acid-binding protein